MNLHEQAAYNRKIAVHYVECAGLASNRAYAQTYMFLAQAFVGLSVMISTGLRAGADDENQDR